MNSDKGPVYSSIFSFGLFPIVLKLIHKAYIEERFKEVNKKELFDYLISNRMFIDSLSFEDVKLYRKFINNIYKVKKEELKKS